MIMILRSILVLEIVNKKENILKHHQRSSFLTTKPKHHQNVLLEDELEKKAFRVLESANCEETIGAVDNCTTGIPFDQMMFDFRTLFCILKIRKIEQKEHDFELSTDPNGFTDQRSTFPRVFPLP